MNHRTLGKVLLACEAAWVLLWIALMGWGQAMNDKDYRTDINALIFHTILAVLALVMVVESYSFDQYYIFLVFLFALATDINSVLETYIHLDRSQNIWHGIAVASISAVVLSGLSIFWWLWGALFIDRRKRNGYSGSMRATPLRGTSYQQAL